MRKILGTENSHYKQNNDFMLFCKTIFVGISAILSCTVIHNSKSTIKSNATYLEILATYSSGLLQTLQYNKFQHYYNV